VQAIREQVSLAPYTTFGVGGPARFFCELTNESTLSEALGFAQERGVPVFFLGGGSNLIVSDTGFDGLVIRLATRGIEEDERGGKMHFTVAAGEDWDAFVAHTVARDCAGVECMSGIPGTCGAAPIQNIGAYGQEVKNTITAIRCYDRHTGSVVTLSNAECGFSYRTSIFNSNSSARDRYVVLAVTFALTPNGSPSIRYADLQRYFEGKPQPSLQEVRAAVRAIRASKGMLLQDGDPDCHSAGSFFKNPIVSVSELATLKPTLDAVGKPYPTFPASDGHLKLSAAWLVENAGFPRGYGEGRVGISSKHTLALTNRGAATAAEVVTFARKVQSGVHERFGIELSPEPVMVGF
jgi:UDP-N-acetylmuramate dehydrogenase